MLIAHKPRDKPTTVKNKIQEFSQMSNTNFIRNRCSEISNNNNKNKYIVLLCYNIMLSYRIKYYIFIHINSIVLLRVL